MAVVKNLEMEIKSISEIEQKTPKFKVVTITGIELADSQYDNWFKIQAGNKMAEEVQSLNVGDHIMFDVFLNGKEYKDTVFMNLNLSKFAVTRKAQSALEQKQNEEVFEAPWEKEDDGDLPF